MYPNQTITRVAIWRPLAETRDPLAEEELAFPFATCRRRQALGRWSFGHRLRPGLDRGADLQPAARRLQNRRLRQGLPGDGSGATAERDLICERTRAGLAAARVRGRRGGRPRKLAEAKQLELDRTLYEGGQTDIATICRTLGISCATLYRALKAHESELSPIS